MVKQKKSWEGKRKFVKKDDEGNPNPEVFKYFNGIVWYRMTEQERDLWTAYEDIEMATISKEVIDFEAKEAELEEAKKQIAELQSMVKEGHVAEVTHAVADEPAMEAVSYTTDVTEDTGGELSEDEQKDKIKAELDDLGIRYSHNSKLSTLQKKLNDATNPE